ncbi:MAG: hypothetical protein K6C06_10385, partial [Lachnospiraceae bacterium]|nr:hypothetical protein [Lachnospiraceae bacterium]
MARDRRDEPWLNDEGEGRTGSRYSDKTQGEGRAGSRYNEAPQSRDRGRSRNSRQRREPDARQTASRGGNIVLNILTILLLIIAVGVFAFASWKLWGYYRSYKAGENEYSGLNQQVTVSPDETADSSAGVSDVSSETELDEFGNVIRERTGR